MIKESPCLGTIKCSFSELMKKSTYTNVFKMKTFNENIK